MCSAFLASHMVVGGGVNVYAEIKEMPATRLAGGYSLAERAYILCMCALLVIAVVMLGIAMARCAVGHEQTCLLTRAQYPRLPI